MIQDKFAERFGAKEMVRRKQFEHSINKDTNQSKVKKELESVCFPDIGALPYTNSAIP